LDFPHSADAADIDGDGDLDLYVGNIGGGEFGPQVWVNNGSGTFAIGEGRLPEAQVDRSYNIYTACRFADVSRDGSPDLILGDSGDYAEDWDCCGGVSDVLLNDGLGWFSLLPDAIPRKLWDDTDIALDIQATDLNGDQHLDLLVLHTPRGYVGGWYIQILIGNGDGTFRDETDARLPQVPNDDPWIELIKLVDLDYDGDLDVAPIGRLAEPYKAPPFFLNDGQGHFLPFEPPLDFGPFDLIDIDGHGRRDLLFVVDKDPHSYFVMRDAGCPAAYLPLILQPGDGPAPPTLAGVAALYPVYGQVYGWDWSPHEELGVDLRTPTGRLRDTFTVSADSDGAFVEGFYYEPFEGDSVTLVASSGVRHTFQVKLPRATADPETNTIVGVAEPSARVEAWVWHPAGTLHQLETQAAADGSFSFDFTPVVDWEYGDGLEVGQWVSEIGRGFITHDSPEMTVLEPGRSSHRVRCDKERNSCLKKTRW
jgi:hypothetical protein